VSAFVIPLNLYSLLVPALLAFPDFGVADQSWLVFPGHDGAGKGKQVVLISGDEEYRSEEGLPQLARILAERHGFYCTVLFAIDPRDSTINPEVRDNIPGLEALRSADLMVILTRFRNLPDEQMKYIVDYVESGKPIVGLRTATHAFDIPAGRKYARYGWHSKDWDGGFGRQVLGETWISHHGEHGRQSTRGMLVKEMASHPILRGLKDGDIWCPTDVYGVRVPLPGDSQALVLGQVVAGMHSTDPPAAGKQNEPMLPVTWIRSYTGAAGKTARVFTTTMGASQDLQNEGLRRLLVNACYWATGLEDQISAAANVDLVGDYRPRRFGFGGYQKGLRPADLNLVAQAGAAPGKDSGDNLKGEWKCMNGIRDGQPLAQGTQDKLRLVMTRDVYSTYLDNRLLFKGRYRLAPAEKPKQIDIVATTGENQGRTSKGIYRLEKDTLTLCYVAPGKDRPTDFKSEPGSEVTLVVWKRTSP
jgi:uncharacterized protein (TIGR03067 family)